MGTDDHLHRFFKSPIDTPPFHTSEHNVFTNFLTVINLTVVVTKHGQMRLMLVYKQYFV